MDEVLRLLSRSNQYGAVDVRGDDIDGRIFMGKRGIDLATTYHDEELRRHLIQSGATDDEHLRAVEGGQAPLAPPDGDATEIIQLIREMTVESLYQLTDRGTHFEVYEHRTTPYASPQPFELEEILAAARRRADDWEKVSRTVPDLGMTVDFNRDLGDREEIKVSTEAWKVLSEIRDGASVAEIADRLGTTEFWSAKVVADLVQRELVILRNGIAVPEPVTAAPMHTEPDQGHSDDGALAEDHPGPEAATPGPDSDPYATPQEPAEESAHEAVASITEPSETEPTPASHEQSWWREPSDESRDTDHEEEVEEDTEAFLEKVFSELEETEEEEQEGHGLLRRRRMGALRDLTGDS